MREQDMEVLMKAFDRNGDGQVSFDELLRGIRVRCRALRNACTGGLVYWTLRRDVLSARASRLPLTCAVIACA